MMNQNNLEDLLICQKFPQAEQLKNVKKVDLEVILKKKNTIKIIIKMDLNSLNDNFRHLTLTICKKINITSIVNY